MGAYVKNNKLLYAQKIFLLYYCNFITLII